MGQLMWPCNAPKPHHPHKWAVPDWTEDDPNNYRCPGWGNCTQCGRWLEYRGPDSEALISGLCQFCLWEAPLVRTRDGLDIHLNTCAYASDGVLWEWARGRSLAKVWTKIAEVNLLLSATNQIHPCPVCKPFASVSS